MDAHLRLACLPICSLSTTSCNSNPSSKCKVLPAEKLHALALALPLAERYAMISMSMMIGYREIRFWLEMWLN